MRFIEGLRFPITLITYETFSHVGYPVGALTRRAGAGPNLCLLPETTENRWEKAYKT